jgi:hypothetical protein
VQQARLVVAGVLVGSAVAGFVIGLATGPTAGGASAADRAPAQQPLPTPTATLDGGRPNPDFGFAIETKVEDGVTVIVFDRADVLAGEEAQAAADEQGGTVDAFGNYVSNVNDRVRELPVAPGTTVRGGQLLTGSATGPELTLPEFEAALGTATEPVPLVLEYDDDGMVVSIREPVMPSPGA